MTADSHHRRLAPLKWGTIGVAFMILALAAFYGLDERIAGYVVAALVVSCLANLWAGILARQPRLAAEHGTSRTVP
ncbi:MAG TPA: hypothetical protein VIW46_13930 [Acidimicrobiia bacterium]